MQEMLETAQANLTELVGSTIRDDGGDGTDWSLVVGSVGGVAMAVTAVGLAGCCWYRYV